jgi:DMSO/TMAO reductase YedYZ molybdopterin-dependent catalytic subunit
MVDRNPITITDKRVLFMIHTTRRTFIKKSLGVLSGIWVLFTPLFTGVRWVWGQTKKIILPKGTTRESLISKNPADLDTRNLEITPLPEFRTMGLTDLEVNPKTWRLSIDGEVQNTIQFNLKEIISLPSVERDVLLICPGVFVNYGRWKGVSIGPLLKKAWMKDQVTHITIHGATGADDKSNRFPIRDILSGKVFLAYQVNGETLPRKHGYPLRVVAEDYYGSNWVKYVYRITAEK